jgi:hypothetical protein
MTKAGEIINDQLKDKGSLFNNLLKGKPLATAEVSMQTKTILKLVGGLLALGIVLMVFYKFVIQKK